MDKDDILKQTADIILEIVQSGPAIITRSTQAMEVRGWDSLSQTMILLKIEDAFGIQIPVERAITLADVGQLVDLISDLTANRPA